MIKEALDLAIAIGAKSQTGKLLPLADGHLYYVDSDGQPKILDNRALPRATRKHVVSDIDSFAKLVQHIWPDWAQHGTIFVSVNAVVAVSGRRGDVDGVLETHGGVADTVRMPMSISHPASRIIVCEEPEYHDHEEFIRLLKLGEFGETEKTFLPAVRAIQTKRTASGESSITHAAANYGQSVARQLLTASGDPPPETAQCRFAFWDNIEGGGAPHVTVNAQLDINLTTYEMALIVPGYQRSSAMNHALDCLTTIIREAFETPPVVVRGSY